MWLPEKMSIVGFVAVIHGYNPLPSLLDCVLFGGMKRRPEKHTKQSGAARLENEIEIEEPVYAQ